MVMGRVSIKIKFRDIIRFLIGKFDSITCQIKSFIMFNN